MNAPKELRRIAIEGGLVRLEKTIVEREAKAEAFLAEVARMQPVETGLLPVGCVLMTRRCDEQLRTQATYVIERPPGLQLVRFKPQRDRDEVRELTLSWPRTVWCCRTSQAPAAAISAITDLWVAVTKLPLREGELKTPLFCLPMPNVYDDGHGSICTGNLAVAECETPPGTRVGEAIDAILTSLWNNDLMPKFNDLGIESLDDWAVKSAADPEFHAKIVFKPHRHETVAGLLAHLAQHA